MANKPSRHLQNTIDYVKHKLTKASSDNITVWLPALSNSDIKTLRNFFTSVQREALGYVRFKQVANSLT